MEKSRRDSLGLKRDSANTHGCCVDVNQAVKGDCDLCEVVAGEAVVGVFLPDLVGEDLHLAGSYHVGLLPLEAGL